jgi:hypothetical protein
MECQHIRAHVAGALLAQCIVTLRQQAAIEHVAQLGNPGIVKIVERTSSDPCPLMHRHDTLSPHRLVRQLNGPMIRFDGRTSRSISRHDSYPHPPAAQARSAGVGKPPGQPLAPQTDTRHTPRQALMGHTTSRDRASAACAATQATCARAASASGALPRWHGISRAPSP